MKSQKEILVENLEDRDNWSPYRQYKHIKGSVGSVAHWAYVFADLSAAERITVGDQTIVWPWTKEKISFSIRADGAIKFNWPIGEKWSWIQDRQDVYLAYLDSKQIIDAREEL
jgi:hypothetical protein